MVFYTSLTPHSARWILTSSPTGRLLIRDAGPTSFLQPCAQAVPASGPSRCCHLDTLRMSQARPTKPCQLGLIYCALLTLDASRLSASTPTPASESQSTREQRTPVYVNGHRPSSPPGPSPPLAKQPRRKFTQESQRSHCKQDSIIIARKGIGN